MTNCPHTKDYNTDHVLATSVARLLNNLKEYTDILIFPNSYAFWN